MFVAKDIMTDHVVFVDPDDHVERAIDLMLRHGVSGLPVVDSGDQLLGMITEFDVLDMVHNVNTEQHQVYHYMTRGLQTVDSQMSVLELATLFRESSIRRYPVVENGKLVGIVSRRELIRLVRDIREKTRPNRTTAGATS